MRESVMLTFLNLSCLFDSSEVAGIRNFNFFGCTFSPVLDYLSSLELELIRVKVISENGVMGCKWVRPVKFGS